MSETGLSVMQFVPMPHKPERKFINSWLERIGGGMVTGIINKSCPVYTNWPVAASPPRDTVTSRRIK